MAIEAERKFIIDASKLPDLTMSRCVDIKQGYLGKTDSGAVVRVRLASNPNAKSKEAFLTIKIKSGEATNQEFEYPIGYYDALDLYNTCSWYIAKRRYDFHWFDSIRGRAYCWELDFFDGIYSGCVLGEIESPEFASEPTCKLQLPPWVKCEVTSDSRFSNFAMARASGIEVSEIVHLFQK